MKNKSSVLDREILDLKKEIFAQENLCGVLKKINKIFGNAITSIIDYDDLIFVANFSKINVWDSFSFKDETQIEEQYISLDDKSIHLFIKINLFVASDRIVLHHYKNIRIGRRHKNKLYLDNYHYKLKRNKLPSKLIETIDQKVINIISYNNYLIETTDKILATLLAFE